MTLAFKEAQEGFTDFGASRHALTFYVNLVATLQTAEGGRLVVTVRMLLRFWFTPERSEGTLRPRIAVTRIFMSLRSDMRRQGKQHVFARAHPSTRLFCGKRAL